jgi:prepilin-type N-terminal cleavage/methylation domain-containing protein/prepilin-type processing-associated H-X9-DG protein
MRRKFQNGFTIVELLVVIAIIGALTAILLPGLGKARAMARGISCGSNLHQIDMAMHLYLNENKDTYPCAQDPPDPNKPNIWLWMGRGWRSFVAPYFGEKIDVNNPSVLRCPGDHIPANTFEATSYAYSMAFYHSPQQINDMNSYKDNYQNPKPSISQESDRVAKPSGKIIVGDWNSNHLRLNSGDDKGWWNGLGRRNFLFVDGQVQLLQADKIRKANDGNPNPNLTTNGIEGIDWPQ